jgi:hypothetical protein
MVEATKREYLGPCTFFRDHYPNLLLLVYFIAFHGAFCRWNVDFDNTERLVRRPV